MTNTNVTAHINEILSYADELEAVIAKDYILAYPTGIAIRFSADNTPLHCTIIKADGGKKGAVNCVIAHSWCNTTAGNLSVTDKLALRGEKILELIHGRDTALLRKIAIHFGNNAKKPHE